MTTFSQSINNDIFFTGRHITISAGKTAYALAIINAIRTIYGEIQLDTSLGIPYMQTVFLGYRYLRGWKIDVVQRILDFDFVLGIESFEVYFAPGEKTLRYVIRIKTEDGVVSAGDVLYNIDTTTKPEDDSDEDDYMALTQNGIFYLPVFLDDKGEQVYRTLTQYVSADMGVVAELSSMTYYKRSGVFIERGIDETETV